MDSIVIAPLMFENEVMRRTADGRLSVFDLIRVVGGQSSPREVWKRVAFRHPEVVTECDSYKFPGKGQKETPVIGKIGAMKLLGLLPGEAGSKYREEAANLVLAWYESPEDLAVAAFDRVAPEKILRTKSRIDGIANRKLETNCFKESGVVLEPWQYGDLTNATYEGLLGAPAKKLKEQRGLTQKDSLRDNLDDEALSAIALAELVTARKIKDKELGYKEVRATALRTAKSIKDAIS